MTVIRRVIATAATAAGAAAIVATALSHTARSNAPESVSVVDSQPGPAIETFDYPNADQIKAQKGITLKRGDGNITLVDCSSGTGLMEVWARSNDKFCFRATGSSGWLSLELPSVHVVKGPGDQAAEVTLTAPDNTQQEVKVPKGTWTSVGEATDPQGREFVLVEIRTTK
ncbi:hypothetical protein [Streptomyces sp. BK239]|uniref:hypothetical protein n=1 Tax=Streptomyces sp. BK239 TaxID=2512155 RepID=UPI00102C3930|nr:hypothetical protein [Streptomyces sp. BK239]RZU15017.1 hypothetical protein EV567_4001 [Streptomyces sp. BK239]